VGFVVDKVTLGQVFSEYFGFPCQSSFHQFLHNHPHLPSGAGTIGQQWPQYPKSNRTKKKWDADATGAGSCPVPDVLNLLIQLQESFNLVTNIQIFELIN
jgi:hypothetical protein